jgi:hypothetical protein
LQVFFFFHVFFDWRFTLPLFFLILASPLALFIDLTDLFPGFPTRLQRQFLEFPINIFLFAA